MRVHTIANGGGSTDTKTVTFEASDVQIQNWVDEGEVTHETAPSSHAIEEAGGERHPGEGWEASDGRMFEEVSLEYRGDNKITATFEKGDDYEVPDSGDRATGGDADIYEPEEPEQDNGDNGDGRGAYTLPFEDPQDALDAGREAAQGDEEAAEAGAELGSSVGGLPGFDTDVMPTVESDNGDSDGMNERALLFGGIALAAAVFILLILG